MGRPLFRMAALRASISELKSPSSMLSALMKSTPQEAYSATMES